jgi:hypothetical protein
MGIAYNPSVATDGLVLALDAGNSKSYPGSGTTWTDLSGRGNNGTLTNGPTYSSSNNGVLVFDGVDDYVTNASTDLSIVNNLFSDSNGSWTVSAWFKFPVSPTQVRDNNINGGNCSYSIVGRSGGIATGASFAIFVGGTTTSFGSFSNYCAVIIRGAITAVSPSTVNTNTWNNVVITWNRTNNFSYFNGFGPNAVTTGTASAQTYNLDIGNTASLNTPSTGYHNFEGSIANVSIYNRALTSLEIQQNFNATRRRFGL